MSLQVRDLNGLKTSKFSLIEDLYLNIRREKLNVINIK